eukprot:21847-Eustigmatos_ZCMA.PRE.1
MAAPSEPPQVRHCKWTIGIILTYLHNTDHHSKSTTCSRDTPVVFISSSSQLITEYKTYFASLFRERSPNVVCSYVTMPLNIPS